ncbi:MAG: hypothetical protein U9Q33_11070 [Campylobacterota bacterium]|nr:hypothetical protein [Campylobacterota bacterium]
MDINSILNENEKVLVKSEQKLVCELPPIIAVLMLPISMITLAYNQNGVIVGTILLFVIIYGINTLYKILYNKELYITTKRVIYKHYDEIKYIEFSNIKDIDIQKGFLNGLCDTATIKLSMDNDNIFLVNIVNSDNIKNLLKKYC